MIAQMTAGHLHTALRSVACSIEKRNSLPVLGCTKIGPDGLTVTNLDIEARVALPTIGAVKEAAVIDYHALTRLTGCIDRDEEISVGSDSDVATVKFSGAEYRLASLPVRDFPDFGEVKGDECQIGNLGLVGAMRRVLFSVSHEDTRYYLNGVSIREKEGGGAYVVATNGHRLAVAEIAYAPANCSGVIIPKSLVAMLARGGREPDALRYDPAGNRIEFSFAGMRLRGKTIDGTYPDFLRVIPKNPTPRVVVERLPLIRALKRLRASMNGAFNAVKLTIHDGMLRLETMGHGSAMGQKLLSYESVECDQLIGAPIEAGFNCHYLIDALHQLRGDCVTFSWDGDDTKSSPCMLTSEGDELTIVQMPMRV